MQTTVFPNLGRLIGVAKPRDSGDFTPITRDLLGMGLAAVNTVMTVLQSGKCEPLKAVVHGVALGTVALCAAYNLAAWFQRRQRHLAINAILYSAATVWEFQHVRHHLSACPETRPQHHVLPMERNAA